MKKTVIGLMLGTLLIASAVCFQAVAEPPGPPLMPPHLGPVCSGPLMGPPPGVPPLGPEFLSLCGVPPELIEKLKLTDDQLKQMRLAYVNFKDKTRKIRTALTGLRDEKETMLISGKIDQAKLAKLDEDSTMLATEVITEGLKTSREQISKLTPEQIERLADFFYRLPPHPHGPKMMAR